MPYRTVSYAKCHRCKGDNDRGSQRTCKSCNKIIQKEFRDAKKKEFDWLRNRVAYLEAKYAETLAKLTAAEALMDSMALRKVSREMGNATQAA